MFQTGLDVFLSRHYRRYRGLRLGVVCHPASLNKSLVHIGELITQTKLGLDITCFFGPQHGIRGEKQDNMVESKDFSDSKTSLPVVSLYSTVREPNEKHLKNIDAFVIDLQDIGTRIYTFIYTMANCMRVAKKHGKKVIVLDRPNPINGVSIEGNVLESKFASFVGQYAICTRHGMTIGELAQMFNQHFGIHCDLDVIPMLGWKRTYFDDDIRGLWVPPSPNIPNLDSALLFPGTVLFEGTNVSEGRGTTRPFEWIGAPFIDPDSLCHELNKRKLPGVFFRPIYFQPTYQKYKDVVCGGAHIHILDRKKFNAFWSGLVLLSQIKRMYGDSFQWKQPPYEYEYEKLPVDLIAGTDMLRKAVENPAQMREFKSVVSSDRAAFSKMRKEFLLY